MDSLSDIRKNDATVSYIFREAPGLKALDLEYLQRSKHYEARVQKAKARISKRKKKK
jgi:hypothetical protein